MIQRAFITQWGTVAPWSSPRLVEQDLVICRALVSIYRDLFLKEHLAFRGGTALHKLYLQPQPRYSEDIDLVQVNAEPIKETIDHLREALSWLGEPVVKQKKHNNTLVFRIQPTDAGAGEIHLKIEINCKEHFSVYPMVRLPFSVENDWFSGHCEVLTYELDELVGTKVRALYQRLKGRDLFDVYTALITGKLDLDRVMTAYDRYLRFVASHAPTYKEFVLNIDEKMKNPEFLGDTPGLLRPGLTFNPLPAWEKVRDEIVPKLLAHN
ncbi:MAG: nucleotidyl transferase AbiEii/AbiGii toxin family protein [Bacteroidales bacterium]|nr:nucleotidyl transferase AbiEii/AbiGii toxin family protein [Bacteroidales bacterium]